MSTEPEGTTNARDAAYSKDVRQDAPASTPERTQELPMPLVAAPLPLYAAVAIVGSPIVTAPLARELSLRPKNECGRSRS